ncbi:MAG: sulfate permease [Actinomycetota bacterium]|nr:sulfate permease [Actinomycetota bacterium]
MIFAASWALSSRLYGLAQRFCPSNIVLRRVHTRSGIKWGPLVGLAGIVVYGLVMVAAGSIVRDGGPGWVNLFFIVGFWNACRFMFLIPTSVVRLLRVRHQEKVLLRDWQRTHPVEAGRMDRVPAAQAS